MPNWCSNRLFITGTEHALESFLSKGVNSSGLFTMSGYLPMPEELLSIKTGGAEIDGVQVSEWREVQQSDGSTLQVALTDEERQDLKERFGTWSWYDWALENWGTKWDFECEPDAETADGEVELQFDTAWGPPTAFLESLATMFPMLDFVLEYAEGGMGFGGRRIYIKGVLTEVVETSETQDTCGLSEWHAMMVGGGDWDENEEPDDAEEEEE